MIIVRKVNYLIFITFVMTAVALFHIKNKVRSINYQLTEIKKQTEEEKDKIHLLKAEIAYLTTPQKLKKSIQNYINLEAVKITQMTHDPIDNSVSDKNSKLVLQEHKDIMPVKWRLKRNPTKYNIQPVLLHKKY